MFSRKKFFQIFMAVTIIFNYLVLPMPVFATVPSAPANLTGTILSNTSVQLSWGSVSGATGYKLYQSTNGSTYSEVTELPVSENVYILSNLTPYQTYYYGVTALNGTEESSLTGVQVTTDIDLPSDPSNLTGTPASTSIALAWKASTDGSNVVRYQIYFKKGSDAFSLLTTANTNNYTVTNLIPETQYFFYVYAIDGVGNRSVNHTETFIAVTLPDTASPTVPTGLSATALTSNQIKLSWNASTDNVGVVGYEVYRSTSSSGTYSLIGTVNGSTTSFTNTGVTTNTSYYYKVRAKDAADNISAFSSVASTLTDTQKPTPPIIWAQATATNQVKLTWSGATDNKGVTSYEVYRAIGSGGYTRVATDEGSPYYDNDVSSGYTYKYYLRAKDAAGNVSDASNTVTVSTNGDTTRPAAPQNLRLTLLSNTEVKLNWDSSTDNKGISGYKIYRALESDSYSWISSTTSTAFNNSGLTQYRNYRYYVRAYDAAGNESDASEVHTIYTSTSARVEEETISSASSGTVEIDSLVRLEVPTYALNKSAAYRIETKSYSNYSTSGYKAFGQPVDITAKAGTTNITSFDKDLTLTFYYTSSELGDTDSGKLSIYYWDSSNKKWIIVPSTVSTSSKKVTAKINHFTVFALLASNKVAAVPTLSNPSYTTNRIINLTGKAENNTKVEISFNNIALLVDLDTKENFTKEVFLNTGRNEIKLRGIDSSGNRTEWSATYIINCTPAYQLNDISGHWAEYNIQKVLEMGVTSGYEDKTFRPGRTITRAEFCRFVVAALGYSTETNPKLSFKDSSSIPVWAKGSVAKAVEKGIVTGYNDNTFRPSREITREEMASILIRAMNLQSEANSSQNKELYFNDASGIQSWARGAVVVAVNRGLVKGYSDNTFGPRLSATRAEAITMIVKMLDAR